MAYEELIENIRKKIYEDPEREIKTLSLFLILP